MFLKNALTTTFLLFSAALAAAQVQDLKWNHTGTIRSIDAPQQIVVVEFSDRLSDRAILLVSEETRVFAENKTGSRQKLSFAALKPGLRVKFVGLRNSRYAYPAKSIQVLNFFAKP
jgi:hypothetical protein